MKAPTINDQFLEEQRARQVAAYVEDGALLLTHYKAVKRGLMQKNRGHLRPDAKPAAITLDCQEYYRREDFWPSYSQWETIPANLKTKTVIQKLGLELSSDAVAVAIKTGGYGPYDLFDIQGLNSRVKKVPGPKPGTKQSGVKGPKQVYRLYLGCDNYTEPIYGETFSRLVEAKKWWRSEMENNRVSQEYERKRGAFGGTYIPDWAKRKYPVMSWVDFRRDHLEPFDGREDEEEDLAVAA